VLCVAVWFFQIRRVLRSSLMAWGESLGAQWSLPVWDVVAPVGLSFLTFQAITYLVMVARQPHSVRPWPQVLLFLCFWPTLFAGPILRADRFFAQLDAGTTGRPRQAGPALYGILLGAAQKLILLPGWRTLSSIPFSNIRKITVAWNCWPPSWLTPCRFFWILGAIP